jgi:ATP-dependent DNA ligase
LLLKAATRSRLLSRTVKHLARDYPHVVAAAETVARDAAVLDCENVALDEHGRPSFQALLGRLRRRRGTG